MSKRPLDQSWTEWLETNLSRNCPPHELLEILLQNEFTIDSIRTAMGTRFPADSILLGHYASSIDYHAIAGVKIVGSEQVETDKLQLFSIRNFLTHDECARIVEIASRHLRPSTTSTGTRDNGYRTSSTCDLSHLQSPLVQDLDEKIAKALGIRLPYSESIQAQRYDVGQQFKQHTDYFEPGSEEYEKYAKHTGNRTWTFMIYLTDVELGGGTHFFAIDKTFLPQIGKAIVWNNLNVNGTPNPNTLHAGLPVEAGVKVVITKWFREYGSGPMFY